MTIISMNMLINLPLDFLIMFDNGLKVLIDDE